MASVAGFGGRITINTTVLRAYHWSVDWKADEFDVTCFENFGNGSYNYGIQDYDVTFDAYWDDTDNPFAAPLLINPGQFLVNVSIRYKKALANDSWTFPKLLVISIHNETGVRDVIRYTVTGKATETGATGVASNANVPSVPVN